MTLASSSLLAIDFPVTTAEELNDAIIAANAGGTADRILFNGNTINLADGTLSVTNLRPLHCTDAFGPLSRDLTIEGPGTLTNSSGILRGFFARASIINTNTTTFNNIHFNSLTAKGGNGGAVQAFIGSGNEAGSGGGGAGFGGALFVSGGSTVTLNNCSFSSCATIGGNGGLFTDLSLAGAGGGGGGGFIGNGGNGGASSGGGGGGFYGNGGPGGNVPGNGGGGGGGCSGSGTTSDPVSGGTGGSNFGGVGGGTGGTFSPNQNGGNGGPGGGGGGGFFDALIGGNGGDGGASGAGGGGGAVGQDLDFCNGGGSSDFGGGGGGGSISGFVGPLNGRGNDGSFGAGGGGGGVRGTSAITEGGPGGNSDFGGGGGGGGSCVTLGGTNAPGSTTVGFGGAFGGEGLPNTSGSNGGRGGGGAGFGGAIFIREEGTLIVNGTFSCTGNSVTAGTGGITSALALGPDIFMMSGSTITFNTNESITLSNPIEGNQGIIRIGLAPETVSTDGGGLMKQGSGTLALNGANTYTGTTTVSEGTLIIAGSTVTNISVAAGGTLRGNFTASVDVSGANGGNIITAGLIAPGTDNSGSGIITSEETFTNTATGTLRVAITPFANQNSRIVATGGADIQGGQLEVFINSGNYIAGTTWPIVIGSVTGAFANQANPTQLGPLAGQLQLQVVEGSLFLVVLNDVIFETVPVAPGIPTQVSNCLLANMPIDPNSDLAFVIEELGELNENQLNNALFSLSAVRFGSLEWINARNNSYVADILEQHLFELCCSPRDCNSCNCNMSVWAAGYGNIMDTKKRYNNLPRFDASTAGVLVGVDWCGCNCFYLGAAAGYSHTDLLWRKNAGKGDFNNYLGALYGSWTCDCLSIEASALGGSSDYDLARDLDFADVHRKAKGDFWGQFFSARLAFIGTFVDTCPVLHPYAQFDYHYYHHNKFTEKGADSINLTVKDKTQHFLRSELGLFGEREYDCGCYCYAPYLGIAWVGEFPLNKSRQPASFVDMSCVINALSYKSEQNLAAPQAGIKYTNCNGFSFLVGYKGLYNHRTVINQIDGRVEWVF